MRTTRPLLPLAAILLAAGLAGGLTGCTGHGKHTTAHINTAKQKMNAVKAATEWQTARAAYLAGDMEKALKHVDGSIALNDEVIKSHVLRGRVLLELGNIEGASSSFERAAKIDPTSAEPPYYTGVLNERIARKDRALENYLKAASLDTSNAQYAVAAAEIMIDLGRLDEAKSYLTEQQSSFEHNPGVRQTLGHIAMMQARPADAVTYFTEARLLSSDDTAILEDLARAQVAAGQFADAETTLARLLRDDTKNERRDFQLLRAQVLSKIDRLIDARAILLGLTRDSVGASDPEAWISLGNVCYILNDPVRVRQAASRVIALAPQRPEGYMLRGLMARQAAEFPTAAASFKQAISIKPTAQSWVLLGLTQLDLDQDAAARVSFEEALKLDPANPEAMTLLSQATQ